MISREIVTVKRARKFVERSLPPVRLYLEDVEDLVRTLGEGGRKTTIEAAGYEFDDVADLANLHKEKMHKLTITLDKPHVIVFLSSRYARIGAFEDSDLTLGVVQRSYDELRKRGSRLTKVAAAIATGLAPLAAILSGILAGHAYTRSDFVVAGGFSALALTLAAYSYWGYRKEFHTYSVILLSRRSQMPSFWRRNKDAMIVNLLVVVLTAVVTWVVTTYFTK